MISASLVTRKNEHAEKGKKVRGFYLACYKTTQDGFFESNNVGPYSYPRRVFYNNKNVTGNDVTMTFGIRYWISKQEFVIHVTRFST